MDTPDHAQSSCPDRHQWLDWLCTREHDWQTAQPQAAVHLSECAACQAQVAEVRRYQTLLLRGKAPGLSAEQRASLEERVRMLPNQLRIQTDRGPRRMLWAGALAAAAVLAVVAARPWWPGASAPTFAERVEAARVPTLANPGPGVATGAVEGGLRVADRDGHWRPLASGEALRTGQRLRSTDAAGRLVVPGRFELQLAAHTEVEWLGVSGTMALLRLQQGTLDAQVNKLQPGERFAVLFGAHRAQVVGTRFVIHQPQAGQQASVEVSEGAVRVDAADEPLAPLAETTTMVRAGQRWRFGGGVMALEALAPPAVAAPQVQVPAAVVPAAAPTASASTAERERPAARRKLEPRGPRQFVIEVPAQGAVEPAVRTPAHPGVGR